MSNYDDITQPVISTIEYEEKRLQVAVRVVYDGIEFVGRLWFADESWDDLGLPDRGAFPGRTKEEAITLATRLTTEELVRRHRRAVAEKRKFHGLRKATDDVLAKIRYLNQVAISMRAGLLDVDGAAQEIDLTEKQLHQLIDKLSAFAGIED